jgi:peptidoglycan/xylan/chitin deacetylase (PgdA/CDA1 family)
MTQTKDSTRRAGIGCRTAKASTLAALAITTWLAGTAAGVAAGCPGNPDALGTSRVIAVDPTEHPRIGTMQYGETLPLQDHEVVLTFDDGPLPKHTNAILDTLAAECVKATFFLVGRMAHEFPQDVRRIRDAGHTIGTHSQNHPFRFGALPAERMTAEIEDAIANVGAALGDPSAVAPFFRIPGLRRADAVETYLGQRGIMTWSADFPADDWRPISAAQVASLALSRLEAKGKGILLLHDIQARTQTALPVILQELKARGYRIVHVVPASGAQPKTVTEPSEWAPRWIHGVPVVAHGPAMPPFAFGKPGRPVHGGPSAAQSVWLNRSRKPASAALAASLRGHRSEGALVLMHHPEKAARGPAARPAGTRVPAADTTRPRPGPIRTGHRMDVPKT